MAVLSPSDRAPRERLVEGYEASAVSDCERQQIDVGGLPRVVDFRRVDEAVIEHADVVRPEFVKRIGTGLIIPTASVVSMTRSSTGTPSAGRL